MSVATVQSALFPPAKSSERVLCVLRVRLAPTSTLSSGDSGAKAEQPYLLCISATQVGAGRFTAPKHHRVKLKANGEVTLKMTRRLQNCARIGIGVDSALQLTYLHPTAGTGGGTGKGKGKVDFERQTDNWRVASTGESSGGGDAARVHNFVWWAVELTSLCFVVAPTVDGIDATTMERMTQAWMQHISSSFSSPSPSPSLLSEAQLDVLHQVYINRRLDTAAAAAGTSQGTLQGSAAVAMGAIGAATVAAGRGSEANARRKRVGVNGSPTPYNASTTTTTNSGGGGGDDGDDDVSMHVSAMSAQDEVAMLHYLSASGLRVAEIGQLEDVLTRLVSIENDNILALFEPEAVRARADVLQRLDESGATVDVILDWMSHLDTRLARMRGSITQIERRNDKLEVQARNHAQLHATLTSLLEDVSAGGVGEAELERRLTQSVPLVLMPTPSDTDAAAAAQTNRINSEAKARAKGDKLARRETMQTMTEMRDMLRASRQLDRVLHGHRGRDRNGIADLSRMSVVRGMRERLLGVSRVHCAHVAAFFKSAFVSLNGSVRLPGGAWQLHLQGVLDCHRHRHNTLRMYEGLLASLARGDTAAFVAVRNAYVTASASIYATQVDSAVTFIRVLFCVAPSVVRVLL
jgi:hypothetical protein